MVLLPDGKLVVAGTTSAPCDRVCPPGDVLLARYLPDGGLDPFFGNQGLVITDFGGSETIRALVLQPNGSLVVAGQSSSQMLLARYFGDGRLDATFGVGGQVMASPGGSNLASALVRQPDGKLVVMGQTAGPIVLARYDADGTPDLAFGSGGSVQTMVGQASTASALTVAPDGDLVLVGYTQVGNTSNPLVDSLIVRYRPDGRLHPSFGSGGIVTTDFGGIDGARALVLQPDGKLVVAGFACVPDMGPSWPASRMRGSKPGGWMIWLDSWRTLRMRSWPARSLRPVSTGSSPDLAQPIAAVIGHHTHHSLTWRAASR
jgi:uncharacterized delta-60 repeat protein